MRGFSSVIGTRLLTSAKHGAAVSPAASMSTRWINHRWRAPSSYLPALPMFDSVIASKATGRARLHRSPSEIAAELEKHYCVN
ncbi:hypothetical protein B0G69_3658 [Paraburkholderia sp. RAU2J]|nr:hypothetical protein B0G69_3658 [Paraburkholderia sp. RAU2J]